MWIPCFIAVILVHRTCILLHSGYWTLNIYYYYYYIIIIIIITPAMFIDKSVGCSKDLYIHMSVSFLES